MRRLFRVRRDWLGNFPGLPAVFPDMMAPVVQVQVARAFGWLGHLWRRHVAAHLSIASFASFSASRRVA